MEITKPIKIEELYKIRDQSIDFNRCLNILINDINKQLLESAKGNYINLLGYIPLYGTTLQNMLGFLPDKNLLEKLKNNLIDIYKKEGYTYRFHLNTISISIQLP